MATEAREGLTRRQFGERLLNAGWWALGAAGVVGLFSNVRFFIPRAVYTPPSQFVAGLARDYSPGEVSTHFADEHRVWIVRGDEGIYALVAKCSHLGCRPAWFPEERRFKCPCHGSNFDTSGRVIAGPAPRPLARAAVSLDSEGRVVVNRSVRTDNEDTFRDPRFLIAAEKIS